MRSKAESGGIAISKRVIVVGGGIGGATLAIALILRGFKVEVYEQAQALQELGAGLTLPASVLKIYDAMGLGPEVRGICAKVGGIPHLHFKTGDHLSGSPDQDWTSSPLSSTQSGQTHRAALHNLLVDRLNELDPTAFRPGHRLANIVQSDGEVAALFDNGHRAEGDVLVGCDGLWSTTHRLMFGDAPLNFNGVVAYRFLVPIDRVREHLSQGRAANFIGPMKGLLRYGIRGGSVINCVGLVKADDWAGQGWSCPSSREELLSIFDDWHPDVTALIEAADENGFYKWALFDRDPLPLWTKGRVTLLGDAAHPMLPYLGQGAAQAINDAMVLARALDEFADCDEALRRYEAIRRPTSTAVVLESHARGVMMNQADPYQYMGMMPVSRTDAAFRAVDVVL